MGCFETLYAENKKGMYVSMATEKKNINLEVKHFPINNDK